MDPNRSLGRLDSLLSLQLKASVERRLPVKVPLPLLLGGVSVRQIVSEIEKQLPERPAVTSPVPSTQPAATGPSEITFPLTDLQQAYWLGRTGAFELGNVSTFFLIVVELNNLDLPRFNNAWQRLIERHEMLRAVVRSDGRQQILPDVPPYKIAITDLRSHSEQARNKALADLQEAMFTRVLPSDTWPLFDIQAALIDANTTRVHIGLEALIVDGWSTALLFEEWAALYREEQPSLRVLHASFRDHVLGLQALEGTPNYERAKAYWTNRLDTLPHAAELPLVKSPSSVTQPRFTHRTHRLHPVLWSRFRKRAEHAGLTQSIALCAAYAEVISTWSGSRHFTLNLLVSNRGAAGADMSAVIGNFSATMLLEIDNRKAETFTNRAGRLQQQMWSDLEYSHFSGVRVLRERNRKQGSASHASMPLVFASTVHQGAGGEDTATGFIGHLVSMTGSGREVMSKIRTPQVWLDHQVYEDNGGLVVNWDSVDELFPHGMIDDMFHAYTGLLHRLASGEMAWTDIAPVSAPVEHRALYAGANATSAPVPDMLLHQLFEQQALVRANEPAIISPRRTLTFAQADAKARQVGRWLRESGAAPNTLVALVMEKGWEQVVAALGVLKSGAAYVPIDAGLPDDRMQQLLRDARVTLALTQPWHAHKVKNLEGIASLCVSEEHLEHLSSEPMPVAQKQEDLAYVIYTSGSTGIPKGVMIEHRGAINTICDLNERYSVGPTDRVLALSAMSFDLSVYDIFGVLGAGGAIVIPDSGAQREPAHWTQLMQTANVTLWNSVPALMEMWVDYVEGRRESVKSGAALRLVFMSGDWIPISLPGRIRALLPDISLVSMGGATEASIWSILHDIQESDGNLPSIPYGCAMVNQEMHVLNDALEPCPLWVPGDIFIGGIGLARGYWNDERKTNASFITHPRTGERLYRTGDRGRYLPSGEIEFLGREDFQVKVQGYRIELGEIETTLTRHPGVKAAVVTASGAKHGSKILTAYVVLEQDNPPSVTDIRKHLQETLPEYMVPKAIVTLPVLPLTPVGKVDRKRLPDPGLNARAEQAERVPPRTDVEKRLVAIWEDILAVSPIAIHDDFFEIGGHSLLAVRVMTRVREAFGRELPLSVLAESRTVEKLAEVLSRAGVDNRSRLVLLQPKGEEAPLFLVHPVGGDVLCYLELAGHLGPRRPVYGLQVSDRVDGSSDKTIPGMAAEYIAEIQTRQSKGPYHLGGWSLGGIVAFEMAQQLRARGESVAMLALLDVTPLHGDRFTETDDETLVNWFISDLAGLRGGELLPVSIGKGVSVEEHLRAGLESARKAGIVSSDIGVEQLRQYFHVFRSNLRAMFRYLPQPYSGSVVLFRATDGELGDRISAADPTGGWAGLALLGCRTYDVHGSHYSVIREPGVRTVAQHLKAHLNGTAVQRIEIPIFRQLSSGLPGNSTL
jgi:amino acid adenylation domain-containing protein